MRRPAGALAPICSRRTPRCVHRPASLPPPPPAAEALVRQMAWYDACGAARWTAAPTPRRAARPGAHQHRPKAMGSIVRRSGSAAIRGYCSPGEAGLLITATPASDFVTRHAADGHRRKPGTRLHHRQRRIPYRLEAVPPRKVATRNGHSRRRWHDLMDLSAGRMSPPAT